MHRSFILLCMQSAVFDSADVFPAFCLFLYCLPFLYERETGERHHERKALLLETLLRLPASKEALEQRRRRRSGCSLNNNKKQLTTC